MTVNGKKLWLREEMKIFSKKNIWEKGLLLEITGGYHNDRSPYNKMVYEDILNLISNWVELYLKSFFDLTQKHFNIFDLFL